jgi:RNA polymerase sigma-70 factor (ECF subfamily)
MKNSPTSFPLSYLHFNRIFVGYDELKFRTTILLNQNSFQIISIFRAEKQCIMTTSEDIYSFNKLFLDYKPRFIHFARTYVGNRETAEDIVIDSLMYYWERRRELRNNANIPAYILKVIKNRCLNHLQRERIKEDAESYLAKCEDWELSLRIATLEACNPEKLFSEELQSIIEKVLALLSPLSREIFVRSKYENQTNREIAAALNLSVKSIEYHITKTLKILRAALKDYFPAILFVYHW